MVHPVSLFGAIVPALIAFVFLVFFGPPGPLVLIVALVPYWKAFGPGASGRSALTTS
jgi:hypothetical protein